MQMMNEVQVIRAMAKGMSRQVGEAVGGVTDPETRVALLTAMGAVDDAVERLLCTIQRATRRGR